MGVVNYLLMLIIVTLCLSNLNGRVFWRRETFVRRSVGHRVKVLDIWLDLEMISSLLEWQVFQSAFQTTCYSSLNCDLIITHSLPHTHTQIYSF